MNFWCRCRSSARGRSCSEPGSFSGGNRGGRATGSGNRGGRIGHGLRIVRIRTGGVGGPAFMAIPEHTLFETIREMSLTPAPRGILRIVYHLSRRACGECARISSASDGARRRDSSKDRYPVQRQPDDRLAVRTNSRPAHSRHHRGWVWSTSCASSRNSFSSRTIAGSC